MENDKILAIEGHPTRGKEVIEILKMLGGNNPDEHTANFSNLGYFIGKETRNILCNCLPNFCREEVIFFTLEEFLEKYPFKVGDKVQPKGSTWFGSIYVVEKMVWEDNQIKYIICNPWCLYTQMHS